MLGDIMNDEVRCRKNLFIPDHPNFGMAELCPLDRDLLAAEGARLLGRNRADEISGGAKLGEPLAEFGGRLTGWKGGVVLQPADRQRIDAEPFIGLAAEVRG